MSTPVVVLIDIETTPNLGWVWGKYDQSVLRFDKEWELLSFAHKIHGEAETTVAARPDFRGKGDKALVKYAWKVLDGADVVIGHNIDQFDNKKLRAKFVEHGMAPPSPYKTVDTRKIARSQFGFNSNSLNDLAFTLKLGRKMQTGGIDLWFDCMAGDPDAWERMIEYNRYDVILLEKVYDRLRAWYPSHPNLALYDDRPACPTCLSPRVRRNGHRYLKVRVVAQFHCQACGHYFGRDMKGV